VIATYIVIRWLKVKGILLYILFILTENTLLQWGFQLNSAAITAETWHWKCHMLKLNK
jgi:hypothetical protein